MTDSGHQKEERKVKHRRDSFPVSFMKHSSQFKKLETENDPRPQVKIDKMVNNLDELDIWRIQNPTVKRYSKRGTNKPQGRLDYFCISSDLQPLVVTTHIGTSYISYHSLVRIELKFTNQIRGKGTWKFNNSLLMDIYFIKKIEHDITEVISEYECDSNEDL
ncbi:unnamed protein product [Mytilus edulis]|uniref:Uncharacterized protein n=1 Tax=Mytilus edulis TaxID=6550 RepID=A0A8S3TNB7_MYTED|nr:unnamed protein product [Mytilus edulis]